MSTLRAVFAAAAVLIAAPQLHATTIYVSGAYLSPYGEIKKVDAAGVVSTFVPHIVGTGAEAWTSNPMGLAMDSSGNVYVAEDGIRSVLKYTPEGVRSTVVSLPAVSGDGSLRDLVFDPGGDLLLLEQYGPNRVFEISPGGAVGTIEGPPPSGFFYPLFAAFDGAGDLYIAQSYGPILKRSSLGWSTLSPQGWNNPQGLAFDASGTLYIANWGTDQILTYFGGKTSVFDSGLSNVRGLTISGNGDLYALANNKVIRYAGAQASQKSEIDLGMPGFDIVVDDSDGGYSTPEPASLFLLAAGVAGLAFLKRARTRG